MTSKQFNPEPDEIKDLSLDEQEQVVGGLNYYALLAYALRSKTFVYGGRVYPNQLVTAPPR